MASTRPLLPHASTCRGGTEPTPDPEHGAAPSPSRCLSLLPPSPVFQALLVIMLLQTLLLGALLTGHISPNLLLTSPPFKFDQAVYMSECLHPMGGGRVAAGGGFKALNDSVVSEECAAELRTYFSTQEGQYWVDVARVAEAARQYFDSLALLEPPSVHKVIVFDIDETALSNAREWQQQLQHQQQQLHQQEGAGAAQVQVQGLVLGKAMADASSPPLAPMLALYQYLFAAGYSVTFITGRREHERNATATNLALAGYGQRCHKGKGQGAEGEAEGQVEGEARRPSKACYVELHMRDVDDDRLASVYKPSKRQSLQEDGYTVYGNFGDQFSDLDGDASAPHSFKLPNPSYLIL